MNHRILPNSTMERPRRKTNRPRAVGLFRRRATTAVSMLLSTILLLRPTARTVGTTTTTTTVQAFSTTTTTKRRYSYGLALSSSSTSSANLYEILGVPEGWTDNPLEIKQAYRQLVRHYHPDSSSSGSGSNIGNGIQVDNNNNNNNNDATQFQTLHHAYKVLSDPIAKAQYDETLFADEEEAEYWGPFPRAHHEEGLPTTTTMTCCGGDEPQDVVTTFGGNYIYQEEQGHPQRHRLEQQERDDVQARLHLERGEAVPGEDVRVELPLDLRTLSFGGVETVPVHRWRTCPTCHGTGSLTVFDKGTIAPVECQSCRGRARIWVQGEEVQVRIPPGAHRGSKLHRPGGGHDGWNGGAPGDLWVVLQSKPYM